jgi:phage replication-related protein YjqB (UPF0714/DUF867 family)
VDRYSSFDQMKIFEAEGADYRVRWRIGGSGIAILSIHGGDIEPGTSEIADAIAGSEHTFYSLEEIKKGKNRELHITSTLFDEPTALKTVCHSEIIISIHGCAETEPVVHVGGWDLELRRRIQNRLRDAGFVATNCANPDFEGVNLAKCNLCGRGMGIQMEVCRELRRRMFRDLTPKGKGRRRPTQVLYRFARAVRDGIEPCQLLQERTLNRLWMLLERKRTRTRLKRRESLQVDGSSAMSFFLV